MAHGEAKVLITDPECPSKVVKAASELLATGRSPLVIDIVDPGLHRTPKSNGEKDGPPERRFAGFRMAIAGE